jgi:hypothetical protein
VAGKMLTNGCGYSGGYDQFQGVLFPDSICSLTFRRLVASGTYGL